jgi:hypothetical protein
MMARASAPIITNPNAFPYPQSIRISKAATLFTITAQLTADAADGKSYSQTIRRMGNSFVHELTISAVDTEVASLYEGSWVLVRNQRSAGDVHRSRIGR